MMVINDRLSGSSFKYLENAAGSQLVAMPHTALAVAKTAVG
jgi:hypothetical protein